MLVFCLVMIGFAFFFHVMHKFFKSVSRVLEELERDFVAEDLEAREEARWAAEREELGQTLKLIQGGRDDVEGR